MSMKFREKTMIRQTGLLITLGLLPLMLSACASPPKPVSMNPADWRNTWQPPLSQEDHDQLTKELVLAHAIPLAATRSAEIQAERKMWLASIEIEPQATSLPDPMMEFGYQLNRDGVRDGVRRWKTGIRQTIPWWRKLWGAGRIANSQAAIAQLRYEAALRNLIINVKNTYYELYYLDQALAITKKIEILLKNDALLAYQELSIGRTQLNEAFRAESWAAQLSYDRILLEEQRSAQSERMRALLNLPPGTPIGPAMTCPLYQITPTIDPLYRRAEEYSEILKMQGMGMEKSGYELYMAKLSRIPDLSVGLMLENMPGMMGVGADNPISGLLTMNLPIWEQRTRALIREKEALQEAAQQQAINETNQVRMAVAKAYFSTQLTQRLSLLYAQTLLPQAEAVMRQAEIDFRNDQTSFSNLLESTLAWHNFQLAYHRALADHGQAIGQLEQVLGTTAEPEATTTEESKS